MPAEKTASTPCVSFRLGREGFGIALDQVREITLAGRVAPVPLAPAVIRGIVQMRGGVVTLIDVATMFGRPLPPASGPGDELALILAPPFGHLGLYVRAPVEIGCAAAPRAEAAAMRSVAGPGLNETAEEEARAPAGGLAALSGEIVHLLSAKDMAGYCQTKVLERFRRAN